MRKKTKSTAPVTVCPVKQILDRLSDFVLGKKGLVLSQIETVIYDNHIINELENVTEKYNCDAKRAIIIKFVGTINDEQIAKMVLWLFKERVKISLGEEAKKKGSVIGLSFINIIKELLWVSYYLENKPRERMRIAGSPILTLSRLQGVSINREISLSKYNKNREQYIENILSLKNGYLNFLPYPDHIDPGDLLALLVENDAITDNLRSKIDMLYHIHFTPDERYHLFDYIKIYVKEKLEEKTHGQLT